MSPKGLRPTKIPIDNRSSARRLRAESVRVGLAESGVAVRGVVVGGRVHLRGVARRASALHALAVGRGEPADTLERVHYVSVWWRLTWWGCSARQTRCSSPTEKRM